MINMGHRDRRTTSSATLPVRNRLLVLDKDNHLIGLITATDFVRLAAKRPRQDENAHEAEAEMNRGTSYIDSS